MTDVPEERCDGRHAAAARLGIITATALATLF
jgi:hypothetical protein